MREHTGTALAIAAIATFGYTIWAAVIAIVMWLSLTVYAVVKWIGAPSDHASPLTVLLLMIANVVLFVVLLTVAIYLAGKPMRYRRRRDGDRDELAAEPRA
jgi:heme/copper-type cytochrome/quinol oxidase subunit 2